MNDTIPIIDLFAGPGGLGEGFSAFKKNIFRIKLSIEMNQEAHLTLELRSFFRQFKNNTKKVPKEYYDFLKGKITREKLFEHFPVEYEFAKREAWCTELGKEDPDLIDSRIREVLCENKNWVLIGGPPCQAYSLVGRSRVGGIDKEDKRVYLYREYLRIIAVHHPAIFVMENVKGLLSAKVNDESMFNLILNDLKEPGSVFKNNNSPKYKVYSLTTDVESPDENGNPNYKSNRDYLIKSEKYGIPQNRHRIILLGIREDIEFSGSTVLKKKSEIMLKEVIGDLPVIRSVISRKRTGYYKSENKLKSKYEKIEDSYFTWLKYINKFMKELSIKDNKTLTFNNNNGAMFIPNEEPKKIEKLSRWFKDKNIGGVCNHESRSHLLSDLKRYIFAAEFLNKKGFSPKLNDYPDVLLPDHKNARSGKFADRFRVQNPDKPATTVTSHISKDGHYFIHYDMNQCRSLTVREAARIQTFPDNYFFCGPRTQQFHQVGNAVPPLLAYQIAGIVFKIIGNNDE